MSSKTPPKNRPRLGRGLSSLISMSNLPVELEVAPPLANISEPLPASPLAMAIPAAVAIEAAAPISPTELAIDLITPNPHQPRQVFDQTTLNELAASIKSTGVIQPVLVRKNGQQYQLIAGERRLRAAKLAGLSTIPVLVRDVDSVTQAQMALIENIQRQDLNPIDRAMGYRSLIDQLGLTQAELASRLGEDRSGIANHLRLLELAEPVRALIREGRLSLGHAKLIAGVSDILEQERLANVVVQQELSVRNLERLQQQPVAPMRLPQVSPPTAHLQDLEKALTRQLGLRVQVRAAAKKGKGKLIVHYATLDQFDDLLTRLGVQSTAD